MKLKMLRQKKRIYNYVHYTIINGNFLNKTDTQLYTSREYSEAKFKSVIAILVNLHIDNDS